MESYQEKRRRLAAEHNEGVKTQEKANREFLLNWLMESQKHLGDRLDREHLEGMTTAELARLAEARAEAEKQQAAKYEREVAALERYANPKARGFIK